MKLEMASANICVSRHLDLIPFVVTDTTRTAKRSLENSLCDSWPESSASLQALCPRRQSRVAINEAEVETQTKFDHHMDSLATAEIRMPTVQHVFMQKS
jgi:hypothetical protein